MRDFTSSVFVGVCKELVFSKNPGGLSARRFGGRISDQWGDTAMNRELCPGWMSDKDVEVIECGGISNVTVKGRPYMRWDSCDEVAQRIAIVQLYECGFGTQEYLATAFGVHVNSVQRYLSAFVEHGTDGLISQRAGPKGRWKITPDLRAKILMIVLQERIVGAEAIRCRLQEAWSKDVGAGSIRQVLWENGLLEENAISSDMCGRQGELFDGNDEGQLSLSLEWGGEPEKTVLEVEARKGKEMVGDDNGNSINNLKSQRNYSSGQRVYLDQLEQGNYNAYAGGLLFAPLLEQHSFLSTLRGVINTSAYEGYSLEELCLTLFHFDVFRFRSMEDFKRAYPEEFGVLIGRSHSPSLFTLRRFLNKVRELDIGEKLIDGFACHYLKTGIADWGVMYIDGHFLPYHGMYPIKMGWHGVRQIPMKGSCNFIVVDEKFTPWLFLIRSSSEDLLKKIPELIEKAKQIGLQAGLSHERVNSLIVLFDREGYSAELYRYLDGKDEGEGPRRAVFISWAKYADKWMNDLAEDQFDKTVCVAYEIKDPEDVKYFETERTMNKYGKIRAIVVQSGADKKRAVIYTNGNAETISAERVVQLMCRRWGEENLIKELMLKHEINYMPGYVTEDMDEQPLVDNPEVKELKKKRSGLKNDLHKSKVELADHMLKNNSNKKKDNRQKGELEILESIARIDNAVLLTDMQIDKLPTQVRFNEAHEGKMLLKLNYEKKRFLDCIKVFAYNMKDRMCQILLEHYDKRKEVLPALEMIVERAGHVKLEQGRLSVTLRRFKNREIDYAARHLCDDLNRMQPFTLDKFHIPLYYDVQ